MRIGFQVKLLRNFWSDVLYFDSLQRATTLFTLVDLFRLFRQFAQRQMCIRDRSNWDS